MHGMSTRGHLVTRGSPSDPRGSLGDKGSSGDPLGSLGDKGSPGDPRVTTTTKGERETTSDVSSCTQVVATVTPLGV